VLGLLGRDDVRLITLTGPGGTGKTRLAVAVAEALEAFEDGVHFVDLTAVIDPTLVATSIAQSIGLREAAGQSPAESLLQHLAAQRSLLVLDNFEQVLPAAPLVGKLLGACPQLKIVVTSRAVLRLSGEYEFIVPPLTLPDADESDTQDSEALALFISRAQAVAPGLRIEADTVAAVAQICARLDGLPLAIELAAARVKLLPPTALLTRLDRRLSVLTGGRRDAPGRHQSLRNTIDWSFQLLSQRDKALFARLGVFVGGFSLGAAEVVCALHSDEPDDELIADGIGQLLDMSLVQQAAQVDGEPRYRLLETLREYALERLDERGEAEQLRARHATHFLELAEHAEQLLSGPDAPRWVARLAADADNLRAALRTLLEQEDSSGSLRLAAALWRYWSIRGQLNEGRRWLDSALTHPSSQSAPPSVRGRALNGAGALAFVQGEYEAARDFHEQSLAMRRTEGDRKAIAGSLNNLGIVALARADFVTARPLLEESLALKRELGDPWDVAMTLANLALVASQQDDHAAAEALSQESLDVFRGLGDRRGVANALTNLASSMVRRAEHSRALELLREALVLRRDLGDQVGIAECLEGLGEALAVSGRALEAATVFGGAQSLREQIGAPMAESDRADYERALTQIDQRLSATARAAAWESGRVMSLGAIVGYVEGTLVQAEPTSAARAPRQPNALTRREREVARLVARGLTNREIAEALVITEGTAGIHVQHVFDKLGVHSRAQLATWVAQHEPNL
jgi:predicted ATPase/DNA-binding CsgD family transcriptional regulator